MEDKIIIDGINVTECPHFRSTDEYDEPNMHYDDSVDAYYKCQPKSFRCVTYVRQLEEKLDSLKQENEKLKETCDGLLKIQYALADESKKFEGVLEEIREQLKAVSYLAPLSTRSLKHAIEGIINEVLDE